MCQIGPANHVRLGLSVPAGSGGAVGSLPAGKAELAGLLLFCHEPADTLLMTLGLSRHAFTSCGAAHIILEIVLT
jgi:hypothetical protein